MALTSIQQTLVDLGLSTPDSFVAYYPRVRDRDDIGVLKCENSGAFVLTRADHMSFDYYQEKTTAGPGELQEAEDADDGAPNPFAFDDERRARQFEDRVRAKRWVDIGTGTGGIFKFLTDQPKERAGVEPSARYRARLQRRGVNMFAQVEDAPAAHFDVATLFHVFEHFTAPLDTLAAARRCLAPGGEIVIEVPNANDILLSVFDLDAFKKFTLWSEHLILHTRETLETMLRSAGFADIIIDGYQRFPLANHLRWLAEGKPGGHQDWIFRGSEALDAAYARHLADIDKTDTLIAVARA